MSVREVLAAERLEALARVAALERELASALEAAAEGTADDEHDPEGSTTAFERAQVAAVLDQVSGRVRQLDAALARVDDPDFGRCAVCGEPVGEGRLAVRPWATTCVRCAAGRR